mgnify:CR=1 FL=1
MDALEGAERQMIRLRGINHQQWKQIALDTCMMKAGAGGNSGTGCGR